MECRPGCGACCIAISISSPLPGLPNGKRAGELCPHLDDNRLCRIYDRRPPVCRNFRADPEYCGSTVEEAMDRLADLERVTSPLF